MFGFGLNHAFNYSWIGILRLKSKKLCIMDL